MADDRYWTDYSAWGPRFDVDAVLKTAKPVMDYSVWRRGDTTYGAPAITSGISMVVFAGGSEAAFRRAVKRFLARERRFLLAVRKHAARSVRLGIGTVLFVRDKQVQPIGVELPSDILQLLAETGAKWRVGALPCYDDGTPKLGAVQQPDAGIIETALASAEGGGRGWFSLCYRC